MCLARSPDYRLESFIGGSDNLHGSKIINVNQHATEEDVYVLWPISIAAAGNKCAPSQGGKIQYTV